MKMQTSVYYVRAAVVAMAVLVLLGGRSASAATTLPDPTDTFDGIPVAIPYDEFWSYSGQLLDEWGFAGFDGPAGVGGLDVVLMTGAGGIDNDPVNGGFTFEDPSDSPSGEGPGSDTFADLWGAGLQDNGPVLVDDVLEYLAFHFGPDTSIPVFTFDMAEPQNANKDLQIVVQMSVYDPVSETDIAAWSLDAIANGVFDPAAWVTVPGEISVTGVSTTTYTVANNVGSGKVDFIVFAPTMDLSAYEGQGYEFHLFAKMQGLQGSHEEAYLSGGFAAPDEPPVPPVIPEPSSLLLMAGGLGALARRRRKLA